MPVVKSSGTVSASPARSARGIETVKVRLWPSSRCAVEPESVAVVVSSSFTVTLAELVAPTV